MKFSIVQGRPGYDPTHSRAIKRITVDGQQIEGCIEADEEQGFALRLEPDLERGGFKADELGKYVILQVSGHVVIELQKQERDWDQNRTGEAKVQVGRDANGDILVQVYSHVRPGAIKQMRISRGALSGQAARDTQMVGISAGAAAEQLCSQFGDRLDPSECARVAVEQAWWMFKDEAQVNG